MKQPKIRLRGFSGEWKTGRIENTASLKSGDSFDFRREYRHIYPCYGGNGIRDYVDIYSHDGCFPIIGRQGALCGNVTLAKGKFYATEHAVVATTNKSHCPEFLYYAYTRLNLNQYATGCAQPGLAVFNINKVKINYPERNEQQAIADYFQHLDTLIQSTAKKIESLKQVKAASLQSMFPQDGETTPRVRFRGFEGEWEKVLVGAIGTTYSGLSGKTKEDFVFGNARYITFLNVLTNAKIDISILETVYIAEGERQNEVKKGDLFVCSYG